MTPILILGGMALAGAALIALPLVFKRGSAEERAAFDRAVFRDQLRELERDIARGVVSEADASAARTEIERRILATAEGPDASGGEEDTRAARITGASRAAIVSLAIALPIAAGAIYLVLGSPDLPGQPFASRTPADEAPAGPTTAQIATMVEMLERRLNEHPEELQGWAILTTAYLRLGRKADAERALNTALELAASDKARGASIAANYGEALVAMADGQVTPGAKSAFERALALAPKHPAAGYYLGLAELQAGDAKAALAIWRRIAEDAPKDAPWLPQLNSRIDTLAKERGLETGSNGESGGE